MACSAYIADITEPNIRTKRLAFLTGCFGTGFTIGKAVGGVLKEELGFTYTFAFGTLVSVLSCLYAMLFLKDSALIREERLHQEAAGDGRGNETVKKGLQNISNSTFKEKLKEMFSLMNVRAVLK